jgi:cell division protein FtsW (lipid II flippase)
MHATWRARELTLLITALCAAAIGLATIALVMTGVVSADSLRSLFVFAGALLVVHVILSFAAPHSDQVLLPVTAMLTVIGLVAMQRFSWVSALGNLGQGLPGRQLAWVLIALGLLVAAVLTPGLLRALRHYRYLWLLGGLALVALTLLVGEDVTGTGTRLWIAIGPYHFQPSEVLKILMVAFLASYLDERRELLSAGTFRIGPLPLPPLPYLLPLLFMWGLSLAVLVLQEDLGAAALFFGVFLAMLYMATGKGRYVAAGIILFVFGAFIAYHLFSHVQVRVGVWLNPWADSAGRGYQTIQSLVAMAAGGVFGAGLGYGHPGYIPAVHTDLVFAALGEEIGLAGLLAIVGLYLVLVTRGLHIALHTVDGFNALLAAGLSLSLGLQAMLILGGTLRVLPLTGITLPFISYGGSSLVTNYLIIGILLRVSMERQAA